MPMVLSPSADAKVMHFLRGMVRQSKYRFQNILTMAIKGVSD